MSYEYSVSSNKKLIGFIIVLLLHIVIIYALVNGLARDFVKKIAKNPVMVSIIEEVKVPPPPPPPPPKIKPKPVPPPPAYVPPPQVDVEPVETVDTIQAEVAEIEEVVTAPIVEEIEEPEPEPEPEPHVPVVVAAKLLPGCEAPLYPDESIDMEEEGVSRLTFDVDVNGNVMNEKVTSSSGFVNLDDAAIEAFGGCKFSPGTVDGTPVKSQATITYEWRLE